MPAPPRLPAAVAYAVALAIPLVAFALQLGFPRLFEKTPFLLLSLAPPAVAWAAGGGPAVAAVVLSSVLGGLFLSRLGAVDPATGVLFSALPLLPASAVGGALGWLARLGFEERERSAHALRESENLYRTLFDLSPYGVALMAPDGRFVAFNASAHRDLGYTREEFTRLTVADLEAEEDPAEIRRHIDTIQASGADDFTGHHRTRSGEVRERRVQVRTVTIGDQVLQLTTWLDETERRRLEAQLAESQRLESVGRLAGGVAHDFNNLLTVVLCCTEGMREDLASGRPVDREDVEGIGVAGERARDLTRQLLAFARKQIVAPEVLDLNAIVGASERLLRRVLGEDVTLSTRLSPGLWRVRCDPAQVEQVILNLAVNARDAMPDGGRLQIETANVPAGGLPRLPDLAGADWVRLTVRDSGTGMSPEVKAHLFEPFFTTKPTGQGTGLGLATVYGIVKQSGGQIHVESDPARGTGFDVLLPRLMEEDVAAPGRVDGGAARFGGNVLLVEDDAGVREVAARALREGGFQVLDAGGAGDAMELATRSPGPVDVLVTDVVMPGMNGKALADELRRRRPALKVLFVSGYPDDIIGRHGVLDPGVEILPKPFTPAALVARVGALMSAASALPPS